MLKLINPASNPSVGERGCWELPCTAMQGEPQTFSTSSWKLTLLCLRGIGFGSKWCNCLFTSMFGAHDDTSTLVKILFLSLPCPTQRKFEDSFAYHIPPLGRRHLLRQNIRATNATEPSAACQASLHLRHESALTLNSCRMPAKSNAKRFSVASPSPRQRRSAKCASCDPFWKSPSQALSSLSSRWTFPHENLSHTLGSPQWEPDRLGTSWPAPQCCLSTAGLPWVLWAFATMNWMSGSSWRLSPLSMRHHEQDVWSRQEKQPITGLVFHLIALMRRRWNLFESRRSGVLERTFPW